MVALSLGLAWEPDLVPMETLGSSLVMETVGGGGLVGMGTVGGGGLVGMGTVGRGGLVGMDVTDGIRVGLGCFVGTGPPRGLFISTVGLLTEEVWDGRKEGGCSGLGGKTAVCFPPAPAIGISGLRGGACFSMATGVGGSGLAGEACFSMATGVGGSDLAGEACFSMATDGSSLGETCFPMMPPVCGSGLDGDICLSTDTVVGGSGLTGGRWCFSTAMDAGGSGFEGGTCLVAPVGSGDVAGAAVVGAHGRAVLPSVCGSGLLTGPLATAAETGFLSA